MVSLRYINTKGVLLSETVVSFTDKFIDEVMT